MKKILFSFTAILFNLLVSSQVSINFENGSNFVDKGYGISSVDVVANPYVVGINTSANVLRVTDSGADAYGGLVSINALPVGEVWSNYKTVKFKIALDANASTYTQKYSEVIGGGSENSPGSYTYGTKIFGGNLNTLVSTGTWVQMSFPINNLVSPANNTNPYLQIRYAIKDAGKMYYIDDIVLVKTTNIVADLESGDLDNITVLSSWSAGSSCSVIDNTYKVYPNTSNKVLSVVNKGNIPVTFPVTLPLGMAWTDYKSVRMKICPSAGTSLNIPQVQIGLHDQNWGMENIGTLSNVWATGTIGTWYVIEVPIAAELMNTYITTKPAAKYLLVKYNKGTGNDFLIDDVELVKKTTPEIKFELAKNPAVNRYRNAVSIVANPYPAVINPSENVLKIIDDNTDNTGGAIGIDLLPAGDNWNNYASLKFKFAVSDITYAGKLLKIHAGGPNSYTSGTQLFAANASSVTTAGTWYEISISINNLVAEGNKSNPFLQFAYGARGGTFYLDDFKLVKKLSITTSGNLGNDPTFEGTDIAVSNNAELTVDASTTVLSITVNQGAKLTVNSDKTLSGSITLESTINGTATMNDSYNSPTLSATVKQYLEAGRNWYISSPISSSGYSELNKGNSVVEYNETTNLWDNVISGNLVVGKGYIQVATAAQGTTGTLAFKGTTNSGNITVSLSRTADKGTGFNLVGNPYPSYLDWSMIVPQNTNVLPTAWFRTKKTIEAGGGYTFATVNAATPSNPEIVTNDANTKITKYIPPMQAYWVRLIASPLTTNYTVTNAMRAHIDYAGNKFKAPKVEERKRIRLQLANGMNTDETLIYFDKDASNQFDNFDSPKMMNNSDTQPDLYTKSGHENLVINGLNKITEKMELALGFSLNTAAKLTFKTIEFSNFVNAERVYLIDKVENTQTELLPNTEYPFSTVAATVNNESRFSLMFRVPTTTTGIEAVEKLNATIFINAQNEISILNAEQSNYCIYNSIGQIIKAGNICHSPFTSSRLNQGMYIVRVSKNNKELTTRVIVK